MNDTPAEIQILYQPAVEEEPWFDPRTKGGAPDLSKLRDQSYARRDNYRKTFVLDANYSEPVAVKSQLSIKRAQNELFGNLKGRLKGMQLVDEVETWATQQRLPVGSTPQANISKLQIKYTDTMEKLSNPNAQPLLSARGIHSARVASSLSSKELDADMKRTGTSSRWEKTSGGKSIGNLNNAHRGGQLSARRQVLSSHKAMNAHSLEKSSEDARNVKSSAPSKVASSATIEIARSTLVSHKIQDMSSNEWVQSRKSNATGALGAQSMAEGRYNAILSGKKAKDALKHAMGNSARTGLGLSHDALQGIRRRGTENVDSRKKIPVGRSSMHNPRTHVSHHQWHSAVVRELRGAAMNSSSLSGNNKQADRHADRETATRAGPVAKTATSAHMAMNDSRAGLLSSLESNKARLRDVDPSQWISSRPNVGMHTAHKTISNSQRVLQSAKQSSKAMDLSMDPRGSRPGVNGKVVMSDSLRYSTPTTSMSESVDLNRRAAGATPAVGGSSYSRAMARTGILSTPVDM
jgi:hypothetical protein